MTSFTWYTYTHWDTVLGCSTLEFDVEVEYQVTDPEGSPWIEVIDVNIYENSLFKGDDVAYYLAHRIKAKIEDDTDFVASLLEKEGYVYEGLGGNDPDGRMVKHHE